MKTYEGVQVWLRASLTSGENRRRRAMGFTLWPLYPRVPSG